MTEYNNSGPGAGQGMNAPKLTDTEAADYTARKHLAGTDGCSESTIVAVAIPMTGEKSLIESYGSFA